MYRFLPSGITPAPVYWSPSVNLQNSYKVYQTSDTVRMRFIQAAKNPGFSLAEVGVF
jgi:DNA-binding transcriptional MerR regulator